MIDNSSRASSHRRFDVRAVGTVLGGCLRAWLAWFWLALVALLLADRFFKGGQFIELVRWLCPAFAFLGGFAIAVILSEHFISYRWRLVPGYRTPCLIAGAAMGLVVMVIADILAGQTSGDRLSMVGAIAIAFSLGCWNARAPRLLSALVPLMLVICLFVGRSGWLGSLLAAVRSWEGNLACLVVSGFLLAQFARWLAAYDEDDRSFSVLRMVPLHVTIPARNVVPGPTAEAMLRRGGLPHRPGRESLWLRLQDWWFERAMRRGPGHFGWSVRRWTIGALPLGIAPVPLAAIAVAAATPVWACFFAETPVQEEAMPIAVRVMAVQLALLFLIRLSVFQRRPMLAIESLRPVTRVGFVRQLGGAVLVQLLALIAALGIIGIAAFGHDWRDSSIAGLAWMPLAMAVQFAFTALVVWLRAVAPALVERVVGLVGLVVLFWLALLPSNRFGDLHLGVKIFQPGFDRSELVAPIAMLVLVVLGLLGAGIILFRAAYRRWLVADLE